VRQARLELLQGAHLVAQHVGGDFHLHFQGVETFLAVHDDLVVAKSFQQEIGKPFSVEDDGTAGWSLASADDIGEIIRRLIKMPSSPHSAYNVGGPPTSLRDVARLELGTQLYNAIGRHDAKPAAVIVDSIQTVWSRSLESAAGQPEPSARGGRAIHGGGQAGRDP
jgi:hypothetical protein